MMLHLRARPFVPTSFAVLGRKLVVIADVSTINFIIAANSIST